MGIGTVGYTGHFVRNTQHQLDNKLGIGTAGYTGRAVRVMTDGNYNESYLVTMLRTRTFWGGVGDTRISTTRVTWLQCEGPGRLYFRLLGAV